MAAAAQASGHRERREYVVRGEHDLSLERPIRAGARITTVGRLRSRSAVSTGTTFTIEFLSHDSAGPLGSQQVTWFVRDPRATTGDRRVRPTAEAPPGSHRVWLSVDPDQPTRYAEASGDLTPIHTDEAFARSVGLPGTIVHGHCTLAMCTDALVRLFAGGDRTRVRRVATRFSGYTRPGDRVSIDTWEVELGRVRFEASVDGRSVLAMGRLELDQTVGNP
jgi:acyl dehydratase